MENLSEHEVLKRRKEFIRSRLLTKRQFEVLEKRSKKLSLSTTEKTDYYKFIQPKLKVISGAEDFFVSGRDHILSERLIEAQDILRRLQHKHKNQKILISGSFLFAEKHNDIDVFIISKYTKENYRFKKMQISFLKEKDFETLFFSSLAQISVANFKPHLNYGYDITIDEFAKNYELLVNAFLQKENLEPYLRTFLLQIAYLTTGAILNPQQLSILREKFLTKKKIEFLRQSTIYTFLSGYSKAQREKLKEYMKDYTALGKIYQSTNIQEYLKTYEQVIKLG